MLGSRHSVVRLRYRSKEDAPLSSPPVPLPLARGGRVQARRLLLFLLALAALWLTRQHLNRQGEVTTAAQARQRLQRHGGRLRAQQLPVHTSTDEAISSDCRLQWLKSGEPCGKTGSHPKVLDLVWAWQNHSDPAHIHSLQMANRHASDSTPDRSTLRGPLPFDPLVFSMRSARQNLRGGFGSLSLLTPDYAADGQEYASARHGDTGGGVVDALGFLLSLESMQREPANATSSAPSTVTTLPRTPRAFPDEAGKLRVGQAPSWLATRGAAGPLRIVHHWDLACGLAGASPSTTSGTPAPRLSLARWLPRVRSPLMAATRSKWLAVIGFACKQKRLPTFNPSAVGAMAMQRTSAAGAFILLRPHHLLARPISSSDFYSPIYGPVVRVWDDGVAGSEEAGPDGTGVHAMQVANALLDRRFGRRDRFRLSDVPQVVVQETVREAAAAWSKELLHASLSRLPAPSDIDLGFLAAHYTMERHREALLWSFVVARSDVNGDDVLSPREARRLLADLGLGAEVPRVPLAVSSVRQRSAGDYGRLHGQPHRPLLDDVWFTSIDGMARVGGGGCTLDPVCFAPLLRDGRLTSMPASALFKHVAFQHWGCGDCIITQLVHRSGPHGLGAFLPPPDARFPPMSAPLSSHRRAVLPARSTFEEQDFSLEGVARDTDLGSTSLVDFVTALLTRYQYALASTAQHLSPVRLDDSVSEREMLLEVEKQRPALFSLTDDSDVTRDRVRATTMAWLRMHYAAPTSLERHT